MKTNLTQRFSVLKIEDSGPILEFIDDVKGKDEDEMEEDIEYKILSIDVGIRHLGISVSLVDEDFSLKKVILIDLIDITHYIHKNGPSREECNLYHTKTFTDWMRHVYQENIKIFKECDCILIERQPPMGLVGIEQLLFSDWRDKAVLINPRQMHSHFRISHYDYEGRKLETERIAREVLDEELLSQLEIYDRKHDVADSIAILLYWLNVKNEEYKKQKRKEELNRLVLSARSMNMADWFEQFRYKGENQNFIYS